jgi:hypothetical protein
VKFLSGEQLKEAVVVTRGASERNEQFWQQNRHEELNKNEASYRTVDTLLKMKSFQRWKERMYFLFVGYKNIGNFEIGPWYNWISYNRYEGYRVRFDLGTNTSLARNFICTAILLMIH